MNGFLRFPTPHGDLFVRPEAITAIEDYGTTAMIYFQLKDEARAVEVTCTAESVMNTINEWYRPSNEIAASVLAKHKRPSDHE